MDGPWSPREDAHVTLKGEELKVRTESLPARRLTDDARSRRSKPTDKLDAEQLAARIGATPRPVDSALSVGSAPWRKALRS